MNHKRVKFFLFAVLLAGFGIFIFFRVYPSETHWEDTLHNLMHSSRVQMVMAWISLSEETALKGMKSYWCPMHPQIKRDKPGLCPICNMQLVEMEEEKDKRDDVLVFTDRQIQQGGIRTAKVKQRSLSREIHTTGRVDVDERLLKTISSWAPGKSRIERLHVNFTGEKVRKGQLLISLYSPELITTLDEYLLLLKQGGSRTTPLFEVAETRLRRWGVTEKQIKGIRKNRRPIETLPIYSPMSGTVIERLVTEGRYVAEGEPLLRLADLSRVWIVADVYEYEFPFIRIGTTVEASPEGLPGKTIQGKIDFIDPVIQSASRTVRVRFEVENPKGLLKPGMYAKVRMNVAQQKSLAVPESAVLLSGRRAVVIVSEGGGLMRPVQVKLGRKWLYSAKEKKEKRASFLEQEERYHEVLSGLREGQEVVVAGNFLIAAEASFQGILKKMAPWEEETEEPDSKLTKQVEASFAFILDSYEKVRKSLAMDNTGQAKEAARRFMEELDAAINTADGDVKEAFKKIKGEVVKIADLGDDIKKMRSLFSSMSETLISFAGRYGIPGDLERHAFVCPMAEGYGGWLQPGKTVENPYLGQKMSTCGKAIMMNNE